MIALGFGVLWVGYAVGFTGYCWVKGYNLSFREIVFPTGFYTGQWPPGLVNDPTVLIPTGSQGSAGSTAGQTNTSGSYAPPGGNPVKSTGGTVQGGHGR